MQKLLPVSPFRQQGKETIRSIGNQQRVGFNWSLPQGPQTLYELQITVWREQEHSGNLIDCIDLFVQY